MHLISVYYVWLHRIFFFSSGSYVSWLAPVTGGFMLLFPGKVIIERMSCPCVFLLSHIVCPCKTTKGFQWHFTEEWVMRPRIIWGWFTNCTSMQNTVRKGMTPPLLCSSYGLIGTICKSSSQKKEIILTI